MAPFFVWLSTKAIHLELVSDLSIDSKDLMRADENLIIFILTMTLTSLNEL